MCAQVNSEKQAGESDSPQCLLDTPGRKNALAPRGVMASPAAFAWVQVTPFFGREEGMIDSPNWIN